MHSNAANPLIRRDRNIIICWLILCLSLVACMVLVGGYTRLSGSGLSITEWKPIHGVIPPLNEAEWIEEFSAYQQSPQYLKVNKGMTLGDFKTIFWPEYWHRVLGRAIGLVFFAPLLVFALRKSISRAFFWRLTAIFALGGLQGLIGWLMVKSGLQDAPRVSHLRLALHLSMAFALFGLLLWAILDNIPRPGPHGASAGRRYYMLWFTGLCLQIVLGAFMAGLHGGLMYNTWPDMNGQMIPEGLFSMQPFYMNFLENITWVQFAHRTLAALVAAGFAFWWYFHQRHGNQPLCAAMALLIFIQFTLGVLTLIRQVPLHLALSHQMMALALFTCAVMLLHQQVHAKERLAS